MKHFHISLYFVLEGTLIIMWIRANHMLKSYFFEVPLACDADALRRSSRNHSSVGTRDEPLRTSAWEAKVPLLYCSLLT